MNWLQALVLGLVQGLTEFLPVSSSGHLAIGKELLGVEAADDLVFEVTVHAATVLATIIVFRKQIWQLLCGLFKFKYNDETDYILKICVSMIPVFIVGMFFKDYVEGLLKRLAAIGPRKGVLTGIYFEENKLGAAAYAAETGAISYYFADKIPGYYHGTGDVFSSAAVAALMNGLPLSKAIEIAVDFTQRSIVRTYEAKSDIRYGVNFEAGIPKLLKDMGL